MSEPVKVFVGTDPFMKKAEIALEWSIRKHCTTDVEIVWMDYARGGIWEGWEIGREKENPYSGQGWATDFTNFRFAIPEANNFDGRAIYLDVDMILIRDIKEFFDEPMDRPVMMTSKGFDVMLFDTTAFKDQDWWPSLEEMKKSSWNVNNYHHLLEEHKMISTSLPIRWNCCDGKGYDPEYTGLIHFTNMHTQPWKPFPKVFKYPPHPRPDVVEIFWQYYEEGKKKLSK